MLDRSTYRLDMLKKHEKTNIFHVNGYYFDAGITERAPASALLIAQLFLKKGRYEER